MPPRFNFTRNIQQEFPSMIMNVIIPINVTYPMSVSDYRSGFISVIMKRHKYPRYREESLDPNHHEKFNYQGINYLIHNPYELFSKDSSLIQTVANHSIIVHLKPKKVIIDQALRSYKPKRFDINFESKLFLCFAYFQTRLLSARRKTTEVLQDLHQEQLQI
jgi:hypothetical protein